MSAWIFDRPFSLILLIAVQLGCAAFFAWDVYADAVADPDGTGTAYFRIETLATLSLICAVLFETHHLRRLHQRQAQLEQQVSVASGALHSVMMAQFEEWGLTPSEQDVATFAIKGMSIAEIADLRGAAEGTVKSQLNAVYRKAGVSGRGALLGLLVDDLLAGPLVPAQTG